MNNEPVACECSNVVHECSEKQGCRMLAQLNTHPADLTDEEILEIRHKYRTKLVDGNYRVDELEFARAILRKAQENG